MKPACALSFDPFSIRVRATRFRAAAAGPAFHRKPLVLLVAALCGGMSGAALAQANPQVNPSAGSILQEVRPPATPAPPPAAPKLDIQRDGAGDLPASAPFAVKTLRITGNTRIATPTLHALVADAEGKTLTLQQLGEVVARITAYYQAQGYALARAIIPAQEITGGVVDIQVIEARYGSLKLDNRSRVRDSLLQDTLAPLKSGEVIEQRSMDRSLLLLSDIPGALVGATVRPGSEVGTSDLVINVAPGPFVTGNVVLDGYGNRFTGRERLGGTLNIVNPLRSGDYLSINLLTSGTGLNYARAAYEILLNGQGTRVGGAYSQLRYKLGDSLSAINAHGTAEVASLWVRQPLLRRASYNLYAQLQLDQTKLRDHVDLISIKTDRHLETWTTSLTGDLRDGILSGGINTASVRYTAGRVAFDDPAAQTADAATARTEGGFHKWNLNLSRLQRIAANDALYLSLAAQWASKNLDTSQKMTVGGPYTVRGHDTGAISGDKGMFGSIEWRHELGAWQGRWQAVAFYDSARLMINRMPWAFGTTATTLSGAGAGLNWSGPNQWAARLYVAVPVGPGSPLVPQPKSARAWVEISKGF